MSPVRATTRATAAPATGASCLRCPSKMDEAEQRRDLGRDFGGPVCGLKLLAIGRPGVENGQPASQAKGCDSYGKTRVPVRPDAKTTPIEISVAMPMLGLPDAKNPDQITTCNGCRYFVPKHEMKDRSGWNAPFCRAKGSLLLDDRLYQYPKDCDDKSQRHPGDRIEGQEIVFLPEYSESFGKVNPATLMKRMKSLAETDPLTWEPDKAASAKAIEMGIRGWRKVVDQKGHGADIYLPIFDHTKFNEHDFATIPKNADPERPNAYIDHGNFVYKTAAMWLRLKFTPAVWGPGGVGKTELFRHMAWLMALPFTRISITESSELDDLVGKPQYSKERGTYYHYGRVPQAWQKANVVCLDEPNTGPPMVWQFLRPLTDNSRTIALDQNEGEIIKQNPFCYLGMAMNPSWDPRNVGTASLGDADGSRLMHIAMGLPPVEVEREIIADALRADRWEKDEIYPVVDMVMQIAPDLRDLSNDGTIDTSWGIRHQLKVARAKRFFSWTDAYALGVADSLQPDQEQAILDVVRSHCPDE